MFQRSEFRRLMSMLFLLVILLMIIQSSGGPGNHRLLIGREGNQDQVVGKFDDDSSAPPERVPATPKPNAAASTKAKFGGRTVALALNDGDTPKPSASAPTAAGAAAPETAATSNATPTTAAPAAAAQGKDAEPTSKPATSIHYNMAPAPVEAAPAVQQRATNVAAKSIPPATGPTDEDVEESDPAQEDFQFVEDGTVGTRRPEMLAYERILRWVTNQSYDRLAARAEFKRLNHAQIVATADDRRGKLFQFTLHVRSMIPFADKIHFYHSDDDPHEPVQVYDLWGVTDESSGRLYQLVVYEPPAGMPIGDSINEDVQFTGYFFKLQGYEPGRAQRGAPPEQAPTFIGRIRWIERPPAVWVNRADMWWIIVIGGGVLVVLFGFFAWLFFRKARPNVAQLSIDLSFPSTVSIDDWLEHPGPGGDSGGKNTRRTDEPEPDDTEPPRSRNGHGNGHSRLFSDRPDSGQSL
jgi:hypothetical protein